MPGYDPNNIFAKILRGELPCYKIYEDDKALAFLHGADMRSRFFVYILANRPRGVLYLGVTNDLVRRLAEHKGKLVPGFTKTYGVIMLVYYEEHSSILQARAREASLKRWRRAWKIELVDKFNPEWRDLSDELAL